MAGSPVGFPFNSGRVVVGVVSGKSRAGGEFRTSAIDLDVIGGRSRHGSALVNLVLGNIPNVTQHFFDVGAVRQVDLCEVGRPALDEDSAVVFCVDSLGLHVTATGGVHSFVVVHESG